MERADWRWVSGCAEGKQLVLLPDPWSQSCRLACGVSEGAFGGHSFSYGTSPHYLRGMSVPLRGREKG